jgi:hypothetical protein
MRTDVWDIDYELGYLLSYRIKKTLRSRGVGEILAIKREIVGSIIAYPHSPDVRAVQYRVNNTV